MHSPIAASTRLWRGDEPGLVEAELVLDGARRRPGDDAGRGRPGVAADDRRTRTVRRRRRRRPARARRRAAPQRPDAAASAATSRMRWSESATHACLQVGAVRSGAGAQRLDRLERRGAQRGIGAGQQPDEGAEQRRAERHPRVEDGRPRVGRRDRDDDQRADARAERSRPASPMAVLSSRNWPAMWSRPAPSARRRPISPTRSSTETSVTLAMPIAPTSSDTPPSSRNSALRSFLTSPRSSRGSGGAATLSSRGSAGLSATGA